MERKRYLIITKNEWERLKTQANPPKTKDNQKEYVKGLIEMSRKWKESWPDTIEGCIVEAEKKKQKQREKDHARVKMFEEIARRKLRDNTQSVKNARQMIFENSCYGKQLVSALLESKTLEERDAQVKYNKEKKQLMKEQAKAQLASNSLYMPKTEDDIKKKNIAREQAEFNKTKHENNKLQEIKSKENEKEIRFEEAKLVVEFVKQEEEKKRYCQELEKQGVKNYEAERKLVRERRIKENSINEVLIKNWQMYQDKIRCKVQKVYKQIYEEKQDKQEFKNHFELLENILDQENKSYGEFIAKGIMQLEDRLSKQEKKELEKHNQKLTKQREIASINKAASETQKTPQFPNKCICERQTLGLKSKKQKNKTASAEEINLLDNQEQSHGSSSFRIPSHKLLKDLKRRQNEPNAWNALEASHKHFAEQAGDILKECKYKNTARKIVHEYWKQNGLNETTLPVLNYKIDPPQNGAVRKGNTLGNMIV